MSFFYIATSFINANGKLCRLADISNRVYVPTPNFIITTSPSTVDLRPGNETVIEVRINATTNVESRVVFSSDYTEKKNGLLVSFSPNNLTIPSSGLTTSLLSIKALNNATIRPHMIPITANISIPTEAKILSRGGPGDIYLNSVNENLTQNSNIKINLKPPLPWYEPIKNWLSDWSVHIFGIPTAIISIITGILGWRMGEGQEKRKRRPPNK
jgi:hypothetical protein